MASNETNNGHGRFWLSHKFASQVLALIVFLISSITGTVTFSGSEAVMFLLGIAGIGMAAHAATNIAAIRTTGQQQKQTPEPTEQRTEE